MPPEPIPPPPSPPRRVPKASSRFSAARTAGIALCVALAVAFLALDNWLDPVRLPGSSSTPTAKKKDSNNATEIRRNRSSYDGHRSNVPSSSRPAAALSNRSSDAQREPDEARQEDPNSLEDGQTQPAPPPPTPPMPPQPPPATIVCQLSGEMGNNLGKYAHCHVVAQLLLRRYHMRTTIVLRHQDHGKWVKGARDLQRCVPFFRSMDFAGANSREFDSTREMQVAMLGRNASEVLLSRLETSTDRLAPGELDEALRMFADLVEASRRGDPPFRKSGTAAEIQRSNGTSETIRVPFLHVAWMSSIDAYVDEFVGDFRELFAFDTASLSSNGTVAGGDIACCGVLPYEDETVFVRCLLLRRSIPYLGKDVDRGDLTRSHILFLIRPN
jgi:hypothetical protein